MEIIGVGTDLVEVSRFRLAIERRGERLTERLFSDDEREYAFRRQKDPSKSLAARFGAKEAVMKAMGVGLWKFKLRDVEVVRAKSGAPSVALHGRARRDGRRARHRDVAPLADPHRDAPRSRWRSRWAGGDAGAADPDPGRDGGVPTAARSRRGTPVEVLMERAGHAVAWAVASAARRHLRHAGRGRVRQGQQRRRRSRRCARAARLGRRASTCSSSSGASPARDLDRALARADLLVDAMFGTGFRGSLEGDAALVAAASERCPDPGDRHPVRGRRRDGRRVGRRRAGGRHGHVRGAQARRVLRARPVARRRDHRCGHRDRRRRARSRVRRAW